MSWWHRTLRPPEHRAASSFLTEHVRTSTGTELQFFAVSAGCRLGHAWIDVDADDGARREMFLEELEGESLPATDVHETVK